MDCGDDDETCAALYTQLRLDRGDVESTRPTMDTDDRMHALSARRLRRTASVACGEPNGPLSCVHVFGADRGAMTTREQSATYLCECGQRPPVERESDYEFRWRCRCGRAGVLSWAHADPPPLFLDGAEEG